jgi:predicted Zn finger-like uncharacterized protein
MSLITRCPGCATAFRVQRVQLAARAGKVRCGKCGKVFDGVRELVEEGADPLRLEPSPQLGLFDPSRRLSRTQARPALEPADPAPMPAFMAAKRSARRATWLWGALALLAAGALLVQAAHHYRTEIAALFPETRAALVEGCRWLGCEVGLPRRPELLAIESSDLEAEGRREGIVVLNALVRNRAPFAQEYPALELTLTDERDLPLLRKVLMPQDYLEPERAQQLVEQGIAASGESALRVLLDTGRARASGYRLYLFYSEAPK